MNQPDSYRNIQQMSQLQQQQFNQQNQPQFFDNNQAPQNQENFQGHEQQLVQQQLGAVGQRNDDRQQQLLQQQLQQQMAGTQAQPNSTYEAQQKQVYQALLAQQNNRQQQNQQQQPNIQNLNSGLSAAQSIGANQAQNFIQNNKTFFNPAQQTVQQIQQQNSHIDINQLQQQSLLQLQMQQKNMAGVLTPNQQQQNALINHYYQQQTNQLSQGQKPVGSQSQHETSQDQIKALAAQAQQIQALNNNCPSQQSLIQQQFNQQQNLMMQQRVPSTTTSHLQGQINSQNSMPQSNNQQASRITQESQNLLIQQPLNQQQQMQQFLKAQQTQLQQNKDTNVGPISQILSAQQNFQSFHNQQQNQQNLVAHIPSATAQSPLLTQQQQLNSFNKQGFGQINQKIGELGQTLQTFQGQAQAQQNFVPRQTPQSNLQLGMNQNNLQFQQQLLNQSAGLQQKLQHPQQPQQFNGIQQQQQIVASVIPQNQQPNSEKLDHNSGQNLQAIYGQNNLSQQRLQIAQQLVPNQQNFQQNIHQQNLLNMMGNVGQANQPVQQKEQTFTNQANTIQQQMQQQLQQANNNATGQYQNPQISNQQHLLSAMAGQLQQQNNSQQKQNQFPFNQNQQQQSSSNFVQNNQNSQLQAQQNSQLQAQQNILRPPVQAQNIGIDNEGEITNQTQNQLMQQFFSFQSNNEISHQQNQKNGDLYDRNQPNINQTLKLNGDKNSLTTFHNLGKLAEFCATKGDYPLAIEYYKHMTTLQPENGPSWMALGHCCLLTDEIHQAFNAYQHALNCVEDIKDPQLWYGIGILYEKFESFDNAISALVGVLKMSPNFYQKSEVLYKLGIIFAKTNQINQAINYFQNSILTNSFTNKRKVDTLLKIGLLYEEKRDFQQAQRSYEAALSNNDKNYKIYQHLAWCNFQNNNITQALDFISKAEKREKDNADSFYIKARSYLSIGKLHESYESFNLAIEKSVSEPIYLISYAILLYQQGNLTGAFDTIIKAQTLKPDNVEVWYNLGILYEKCNQPNEALVAYKKVLEIEPKNQESHNRILLINSQNYRAEMQRNSNYFNFQMIHPIFNVPNTLQILRKYKRTAENTNADGPLSPIVSNDPQSLQVPNNNVASIQINQFIPQQQITNNNPGQIQGQKQQPHIIQQNGQDQVINATPVQQEQVQNQSLDSQRLNQNNLQIMQQRQQAQTQQILSPRQNQIQMLAMQQLQQQLDQNQAVNVNHQQQSLQILQQTQRVVQPQQINQQLYSVRLPVQPGQNAQIASTEQSLKLNNENKIDGGHSLNQQQYFAQQSQQLQLDKNQVQNQQFQILNSNQQLPQMPENQSNVGLLDWQNKFKQVQQDLMFNKGVQGQLPNQYQQFQQNPEITQNLLARKTEESKKPEDGQNKEVPALNNENNDDHSSGENKPRFSFIVSQNNTVKGQDENEQKTDSKDVCANQLQNTYTQFIRMSNPILSQQIQKTNQEPQKQTQAQGQTQGGFTILQQQQFLKVGPSNYNQNNQPQSQNLRTVPQESVESDQQKDKQTPEINQDHISEIMKQRLYQQIMQQQMGQVHDANQLNKEQLEQKKLQLVDQQQEDFVGNQIRQLMDNQKQMAQPNNFNEQIQLIQSHIQANQRANYLKQKKPVSPEILAKKLELVKDAIESPQIKEGQLQKVENDDNNFNPQLQQQKFSFQIQSQTHQQDKQNGPSEYDFQQHKKQAQCNDPKTNLGQSIIDNKNANILQQGNIQFLLSNLDPALQQQLHQSVRAQQIQNQPHQKETNQEVLQDTESENPKND